jgi:hypothetical protein
MRKRLAFLIVAAAACGGSSGGNLDPALGGTWSGTATLTLQGGSPQMFPGDLTLTVSGQDATMAGVCLDGSGPVTMHGSGEAASWQGNLICPAVQFTGCSAVTLTFQSVNVALNGSTLTAQSAGSASGCGTTLGFTLGLSGTK